MEVYFSHLSVKTEKIYDSSLLWNHGSSHAVLLTLMGCDAEQSLISALRYMLGVCPFFHLMQKWGSLEELEKIENKLGICNPCIHISMQTT